MFWAFWTRICAENIETQSREKHNIWGYPVKGCFPNRKVDQLAVTVS